MVYRFTIICCCFQVLLLKLGIMGTNVNKVSEILQNVAFLGSCSSELVRLLISLSANQERLSALLGFVGEDVVSALIESIETTLDILHRAMSDTELVKG